MSTADPHTCDVRRARRVSRMIAGIATVVVALVLLGRLTIASAALDADPARGGATAERASTTAVDVTRDRVVRLLSRHACWTAQAPATAAAPQHAVVTRPGHAPAFVPAGAGYAIWLDGAPGTLHGFCP